MSGTKLCTDCDQKIFARSLCRKHWQAWRDSFAEPCSVDGCETPARAAGMCNIHWQRNYRHGTPDWTRKTMEQRFWEKVSKTDSCWEWMGARDPNGYGVFNKGSDVLDRAHRVAYELCIGEIPAGLHLDHLCRRTLCCNPEHLEPVEPRENFLRGQAPAAIGIRTNKCQRGHSFDDAYIRPDTGTRMCRTCSELRSRDRVR